MLTSNYLLGHWTDMLGCALYLRVSAGVVLMLNGSLLPQYPLPAVTTEDNGWGSRSLRLWSLCPLSLIQVQVQMSYSARVDSDLCFVTILCGWWGDILL